MLPLLLFFTCFVHTQEILHDFVFIICSYNNLQWADKNLTTLFAQEYPAEHFRAIYVDDCSNDGTYAYVTKFKEEHRLGDRLTIIRNPKRKLKAHNLYFAGHMCKKHEIIIELDGDDWLPTTTVLNYLNTVYQDNSIWLTYGNNIKWPTRRLEMRVKEVPEYVVEKGTFRQYTDCNFWTAMRSYYAWLFQKIEKRDFVYSVKQKHSRWFEMSIDASIYFSMLEMARERHKFCDYPLYVHNIETQFNDHKVNVGLQYTIETYLRGLKPYPRLSDSEAYHVTYYASR